MSAWLRRTESLAAVVLVGAALFAQEPAAQEVAALFERARWGEAFEESAHIESDLLRAQWRFHVLYAAGNLPDALAAAREGLAQAPTNLELLHNAALCSVTLGLVGVSEDYVDRWREALAASTDPALRIQWESKLASIASAAQALRAAELEADSAAARARAVNRSGLALCVVALLALALAPRKRVATS